MTLRLLYIKIFNKHKFKYGFKFLINISVAFLITDNSFINMEELIFIIYLLSKTQ